MELYLKITLVIPDRGGRFFSDIFKCECIYAACSNGVPICNVKLQTSSRNADLGQPVCGRGKHKKSPVIFPLDRGAGIYRGRFTSFGIGRGNSSICASGDKDFDLVIVFYGYCDADCRLPVGVGAVDKLFGVFQKICRFSRFACGNDSRILFFGNFQRKTLAFPGVCIGVGCFPWIQNACNITGPGGIRSKNLFPVALDHSRPVNRIRTDEFFFDIVNQLIAASITH